MYKNKRIIAIIPARGGSKGLPNKNILEIAGKPLIAWTIEAALQSKLVDEVFVSTDSELIAEVAESNGISVPFLRPKEYAQDSSPTYECVLHVLQSFEKKGVYFDYVMVLEPTSPLRKKTDVDDSIRLLVDNEKSDTLVSVGEVQTENPVIVKKISEQGTVWPYINIEDKFHQRQQFPEAYFPYGVSYISKVDYYKKEKTFYSNNTTLPFYIERWQNYEIDDAIDFEINQLLIQKYLK